MEEKTLLEAAGLTRKTALAYERLLINLMIVEPAPAWASHRLVRLVRSPKRYLTNAALLAGILRLDANASPAPKADAASHLVWLRDRLGEQFLRGVVLHTGPRAFELEDRIVAAPIATLWA